MKYGKLFDVDCEHREFTFTSLLLAGDLNETFKFITSACISLSGIYLEIGYFAFLNFDNEGNFDAWSDVLETEFERNVGVILL